MKNFIDKYSKYSFEDFLNDDFFISSIRNIGGEKADFWINYEHSNPSNLKEYLQARSFIENIISQRESRKITDGLQQRINNTNKKRERKRRARKKVFIFSSIAAVICGLLVFTNIYRQSSRDSIDLLQYAQITSENRNILDTSQNVRLILSETKIIELEKQESIITYTEENIESDDKKISHTESASYNQLIVPKGKRSQLKFSDGTSLHVNSGTQVIYPNEFSGKYREIYVDGEIFIDVAPNKKQPFIVRTNNLEVEVLGTKFNVLSYKNDNESQVVLASGSVRIASESNIILKPNEMYSYTIDGATVKDVNVDEYISWVQGMYIYEKESLENIAKRLTRYYGVEVRCYDEVKKMTCSGKIDMKDNISDVLDNLQYILPIDVKSENNQYLITLKK